MGDYFVSSGESQKAKEYYEKELKLFEQLAKSDPTNASLQRDLFVSYYKMYQATKDKNYLKMSLDKLKEMKAKGILNPADEKFIPLLEGEMGD